MDVHSTYKNSSVKLIKTRLLNLFKICLFNLFRYQEKDVRSTRADVSKNKKYNIYYYENTMNLTRTGTVFGLYNNTLLCKFLTFD